MPFELNVEMSFPILNASQLPCDIRIVCASVLCVGDRLRPIDSANHFFIFRFVFNDCIWWEDRPFWVWKIILSYPQCALLKWTEKNIFWNLIHHVEWLFDYCSWHFEFLKDLATFIILFQNDIVNFLRSEQKLIKLDIKHSSNNIKFFKSLRRIRVEVNPLKFDNSVCIHPFRRNLRIQSKFFNFNRPKFVEIFCGRWV